MSRWGRILFLVNLQRVRYRGRRSLLVRTMWCSLSCSLSCSLLMVASLTADATRNCAHPNASSSSATLLRLHTIASSTALAPADGLPPTRTGALPRAASAASHEVFVEQLY